MESKHKGLRFNKDKVRLDLIPSTATKSLGEVLTIGAKKYADRNWENGMSWTSVLASLKRHLLAIEEREDFDSEDGLLHIEHLLANAAFLNHFYRTYPEGDDRPYRSIKPRRIGLDLDGVICDFTNGVSKITKVSSDHWDLGIEVKDILGKVDEEFWMSLEPLFSGSELSFAPACYITHRKNFDPEIGLKWLKKHNFPLANVISTDKPKSIIAKQHDIDIFVEDNYDNFIELNTNGIFCLLMDQPYNRKYNVGYQRIYSLNELTERFYISG